MAAKREKWRNMVFWYSLFADKHGKQRQKWSTNVSFGPRRMNSSSAISVCMRRQCLHWNMEKQYCRENSLWTYGKKVNRWKFPNLHTHELLVINRCALVSRLKFQRFRHFLFQQSIWRNKKKYTCVLENVTRGLQVSTDSAFQWRCASNPSWMLASKHAEQQRMVSTHIEPQLPPSGLTLSRKSPSRLRCSLMQLSHMCMFKVARGNFNFWARPCTASEMPTFLYLSRPVKLFYSAFSLVDDSRSFLRCSAFLCSSSYLPPSKYMCSPSSAFSSS